MQIALDALHQFRNVRLRYAGRIRQVGRQGRGIHSGHRTDRRRRGRRPLAQLRPVVRTEHRCIGLIHLAEMTRHTAAGAADGHQVEAQMIEPVRWPHAHQLHIVSQRGALQPIAANEQHLDRVRRLGVRVATEEGQGIIKVSLGQESRQYLLLLDLGHERLQHRLHLGRVLGHEGRLEGVGKKRDQLGQQNTAAQGLWRTNDGHHLRYGAVLAGKHATQLVEQQLSWLHIGGRQASLQHGPWLGTQAQGVLPLAASRSADAGTGTVATAAHYPGRVAGCSEQPRSLLRLGGSDHHAAATHAGSHRAHRRQLLLLLHLHLLQPHIVLVPRRAVLRIRVLAIRIAGIALVPRAVVAATICEEHKRGKGSRLTRCFLGNRQGLGRGQYNSNGGVEPDEEDHGLVGNFLIIL